MHFLLHIFASFILFINTVFLYFCICSVYFRKRATFNVNCNLTASQSVCSRSYCVAVVADSAALRECFSSFIPFRYGVNRQALTHTYLHVFTFYIICAWRRAHNLKASYTLEPTCVWACIPRNKRNCHICPLHEHFVTELSEDRVQESHVQQMNHAIIWSVLQH